MGLFFKLKNRPFPSQGSLQDRRDVIESEENEQIIPPLRGEKASDTVYQSIGHKVRHGPPCIH